MTLESKDVSVRTGHDLEAIIEATKHSRLTWWPFPACKGYQCHHHQERLALLRDYLTSRKTTIVP